MYCVCTGTWNLSIQETLNWACKYIIWFVESFLFVKSFGKNIYCRLVLPLFDLSWCMLVMFDMFSWCHCPNVRDDNIHKWWYPHCWHRVGGAEGRGSSGQLPTSGELLGNWLPVLTGVLPMACTALYTVHHVVVWTLYTVQNKPGVWFWDYVTRRTDSINYFDSAGTRFNSEANPYQSMATCGRWQLFLFIVSSSIDI